MTGAIKNMNPLVSIVRLDWYTAGNYFANDHINVPSGYSIWWALIQPLSLNPRTYYVSNIYIQGDNTLVAYTNGGTFSSGDSISVNIFWFKPETISG